MTDLDQFFRDQRITVYAVMPAGACSAPAGFRPADLLPAAKSLVVFGKEVPAAVYLLPPDKKTIILHEIIAGLDASSAALARAFEDEGFPSVAVPAFYPVSVAGGTIRGFLSLKGCARDAGLGITGMNSLLISPHAGDRLALGAVVTEKDLAPVRPDAPVPRCLSCGKCRESCPTGAITGNGQVDLLLCENVTGVLPPSIIPVFRWLMNRRVLSPVMGFLVNRLARNAEMTCSRCLTVCPYFGERS